MNAVYADRKRNTSDPSPDCPTGPWQNQRSPFKRSCTCRCQYAASNLHSTLQKESGCTVVRQKKNITKFGILFRTAKPRQHLPLGSFKDSLIPTFTDANLYVVAYARHWARHVSNPFHLVLAAVLASLFGLVLAVPAAVLAPSSFPAASVRRVPEAHESHVLDVLAHGFLKRTLRVEAALRVGDCYRERMGP